MIRTFDWSATALGPIETWPQSLKTATGLIIHSPVPIVMLWGDDGYMIYNDAYSVFAGGRHPKLLGSKVREGWPEVADFNDNVMKVGLAGGTLAYRDQELTLNRTGKPEQVWMNLDYSPVLDDSGEPAGVIAIVVETTERVLADRRNAREQDRQRQLFSQMPGFVAVLSGADHTYEYVNDAYIQVGGVRDYVGHTVREVFPELKGQGFYELLDQVYATGERFASDAMPINLIGKEGVSYIDFLYEPIRDELGEVTGVFVGGYDVTGAHRSADALRKSEANLRALNTDLEQQVAERALERSITWRVNPDLLGVLDADGYFKSSNPAWQTVLGWSEEEISRTKFFDFLHPDDLARNYKAFDEALEGQPVFRFENRYRRKDGAYRWLSWTAIPDGDFVYCNARDVTEDKAAQAELIEAQDALRQSQKMEAVGQLTGGIAHDFNNLLAGISGSLEMLDRRMAEGRLAGVERYIAAARESAARAAALTQRLLAFSRRQTLDPKPVEVNKLIGGMEDLIRRTVGPNIEVEVVGAGGLWLTKVDPSQLESALLNLSINARDAMPHGGRITIETANKWLDDRAAKERELPPGQYLSVCVTDTGTGMAPEVVQRAFDPFFTTKPLGQGTGLGLSMIHGFVRQSGGQVRIYTEPGKGTTMCLYLPRFMGEMDAAETSGASNPEEMGQGETVLVIDDEPTVRMLIVEVLQDAGFTAIEADDGPKGLKILQSDARIDLLVTDVGLPGGMNGRQVADAARATRPGLKVLFVTGYAENAAVGNGLLDAGMEVITKPFAMAALGEKVREMIEG